MSQYAFERTTCGCADCVKCCKRQPGALAPGELERIARYLQVPVAELKAKVWASPGALVRDGDTGKTRRIGTITPQMKRGRCVFLDAQDKCSIHPVAPFGCACFDMHMPRFVAHPRSAWLAQATLDPEYQALRDTLTYAKSYRPTG